MSAARRVYGRYFIISDSHAGPFALPSQRSPVAKALAPPRRQTTNRIPLVRRDGTRGNGDQLNKKAHHAAPGGSGGRTGYDDPQTTEAEDDDTEAEDDDGAARLS